MTSKLLSCERMLRGEPAEQTRKSNSQESIIDCRVLGLNPSSVQLPVSSSSRSSTRPLKVRCSLNRLVIQWRWLSVFDLLAHELCWIHYRTASNLRSVSFLREKESPMTELMKHTRSHHYKELRRTMPEQINEKDSHNELIFPRSQSHKSHGGDLFFRKVIEYQLRAEVVLIDAMFMFEK